MWQIWLQNGSIGWENGGKVSHKMKYYSKRAVLFFSHSLLRSRQVKLLVIYYTGGGFGEVTDKIKLSFEPHPHSCSLSSWVKPWELGPGGCWRKELKLVSLAADRLGLWVPWVWSHTHGFCHCHINDGFLDWVVFWFFCPEMFSQIH